MEIDLPAPPEPFNFAAEQKPYSLRALAWNVLSALPTTTTSSTSSSSPPSTNEQTFPPLLTFEAWRRIQGAENLAAICHRSMRREDQMRLMHEIRAWYPPPPPGVPAYEPIKAPKPTPKEGAAPADGDKEMTDASVAVPPRYSPQLYYVHPYNEAGQLHGELREWWPNGVQSSIQHYENGQLHGEAVWFNQAGEVRMRFNYQHGKRHGLQQEWYRKGNRLSRYHCVEGQRHGKFKAWFKSGILEFKYKYVHGKLHGEQKEWHRTEKIYLVNNFDMGKREGPWNTWYESGAKSIISQFKNDQLDGLKEKYDKAGRLMYQEEWKEGKKHGIWKEWGNYQQLVEHKKWENDVCVANLLHSTYAW